MGSFKTVSHASQNISDDSFCNQAKVQRFVVIYMYIHICATSRYPEYMCIYILIYELALKYSTQFWHLYLFQRASVGGSPNAIWIMANGHAKVAKTAPPTSSSTCPHMAYGMDSTDERDVGPGLFLLFLGAPKECATNKVKLIISHFGFFFCFAFLFLLQFLLFFSPHSDWVAFFVFVLCVFFVWKINAKKQNIFFGPGRFWCVWHWKFAEWKITPPNDK